MLLLNPITPHISHALWQALGHPQTLLEDLLSRRPIAALVRDALTLAMQVNGKLRGTIEVCRIPPREEIEARRWPNRMWRRFIEGRACAR